MYFYFKKFLILFQKMEEKKFLSKKKNRINDKNIPFYSKQDNLKYNKKNEILEKEKKSKIKEKSDKKDKIKIKEEQELNDEINNDKNNIEENQNEEENDIDYEKNELIDNEKNTEYNMYSKLKKKLIIILEGASLELGNLKKKPEIINCDDHYKIIKSMKKKLEEFRPDIIHQCLLNLFDSPLNKAGLLQVYVHTNKNIVIEINPKTRIPRTFKRFSGLFTQLLLKNEINYVNEDNNKNEILLKVLNTKLENLVSDVPKILLSEKGRLVDICTYCKNIDNNLKNKKSKDICFIIGTNPKGDIDPLIKYNDDCISISSFDLDSNIICAKICSALENIWEVL